MSLLNKLLQQGSNLSELNGTTSPNNINDLKTSKTHYEYSINGKPNIVGKPSPSELDLDGVTPPRYLDNKPQ
jgi:hypothetical protein